MIKISDMSSLLEIGFAVNAVFAIVFTNYKSHRQGLYDFVLNGVSKHRSIDHISRKHIETFIYKSTNAFKMLKYGFALCVSLSSISLLCSIALLAISSISPNKEINNLIFLLYVTISIIVNPLLYFMFNEGSKWLSRIFIQKIEITPTEAELISKICECSDFYKQNIDKIILENQGNSFKKLRNRVNRRVYEYIASKRYDGASFMNDKR